MRPLVHYAHQLRIVLDGKALKLYLDDLQRNRKKEEESMVNGFSAGRSCRADESVVRPEAVPVGYSVTSSLLNWNVGDGHVMLLHVR